MITPKVPPKQSRSTRKFLFTVLVFDSLMRLTPPLSIFALSTVAVAAYKVSPERARTKIKSAMFDIRKSISSWIKPEEQEEELVDEYEFNEHGSIEQDAKKNMEEREADDKSYPPETIETYPVAPLLTPLTNDVSGTSALLTF